MIGEELVESARLLGPRLLGRNELADGERRIPDETIAEMKHAGLFRALQPKRWGGYELGLQTFYDVSDDACRSRYVDRLGLRRARRRAVGRRVARTIVRRADVWTDERFLSRSSACRLPPAGEADAGRRRRAHQRDVALRQRLGSRRLGLRRCAGQSRVGHVAEGRADWHVLLVPKEDFLVVDTWFTFGLKGTGSNDIVIDDAFVPSYRMRRMAENLTCTGPGQAVNTAPLYRLPFGQVFGGGVAFGPIGALQGMLRELRAFAQARVRSGGRTTVQDPDTLLAVAEAENAIDELTTIVRRNVRELTAYAERGEVPPPELRMKYKFQMATVSERCRALGARIVQAAGTQGIAMQHRFGRTLADLTSARQHITNQHEMHARHWGAYLLTGTLSADLMQ